MEQRAAANAESELNTEKDEEQPRKRRRPERFGGSPYGQQPPAPRTLPTRTGQSSAPTILPRRTVAGSKSVVTSVPPTIVDEDGPTPSTSANRDEPPPSTSVNRTSERPSTSPNRDEATLTSIDDIILSLNGDNDTLFTDTASPTSIPQSQISMFDEDGE